MSRPPHLLSGKGSEKQVLPLPRTESGPLPCSCARQLYRVTVAQTRDNKCRGRDIYCPGKLPKNGVDRTLEPSQDRFRVSALIDCIGPPARNPRDNFCRGRDIYCPGKVARKAGRVAFGAGFKPAPASDRRRGSSSQKTCRRRRRPFRQSKPRRSRRRCRRERRGPRRASCCRR